MNIALIIPRYISNYGENYVFPLGFGYIASSIKSAGFNVTALNLNHTFGRVEDVVRNYIKKNSVNVCFSGGISSYLEEIQTIFKAARLEDPNIINIAGGGIVNSDPLISFELADIDFGVVGEGEFVSVNLLKAISNKTDFEKVEGIVFKSNDGKVVKTKEPKPVMDLATIPWPDYDMFGFKKDLDIQRPLDDHFIQTIPKGTLPRKIDMISSRSCPFSCTFCFHPIGKVYRERPLDEFFSELEFLIKKYNINMVNILDELFSLRKQRLIDFCHRVKKYNIKWSVQLHVNSVDPKTIVLMKESGCTNISYGIESMSEPVLLSMQKKTKPKRIDEVVKMTYESNIDIQGNLIFFDTSETIETANEIFDWWVKNRRYQVYLSRLQVYPGSPDYIMAVRDKLITDRAAFSKELPVSLNISNINDFNYNNITFQLMIHGQTLLRLPLSQKITKTKSNLPRGNAWNISMVCRECEHESYYEECFIRPEQINYIRISCQNCRARIDVRNTVGNPTSNQTPLDNSTHNKNELIGGTGSNLKDVKAETENCSTNSGFVRKSSAERWRAVTSDISSRSADDPIKEFKLAGIALKSEPYSSKLHLRFANSLKKLKHYGAALLHYEQAVLLSPKDELAKISMDEFQKEIDYDKFKNIYFASHSSAKAPFRLSREQGKTYDRKEEPNFPTYDRVANRESIKKKKRLPIYFRD